MRAAFDAYFRGDDAAMLDLASPDIVVTQFPDQVDVRDFHGHEGVREVMADWIGAWDEWTIEVLSTREIDGLVFVTALQRGRGKGSGVPMESDVTLVFTLRQAVYTRWQMFRSERDALKAVGLEA